MPREYRHIEQYDAELKRLKEEGLTVREIGEKANLNSPATIHFHLTKLEEKGYIIKRIENGIYSPR